MGISPKYASSGLDRDLQGTAVSISTTQMQAKPGCQRNRRVFAGCSNRSTVKGKRDYAILAVLVGCALRREELASLTVEDVHMRENRWVIADLRGQGGRIRTAAVPVWVENGINAWQTAAGIEEVP